MGFHMPHGGARFARDLVERTDLRGDLPGERERVHVHRVTAEIGLVRIPGVRADRDAVLLRELDRLPHGVVIAGVAATRDVGGGHEPHQLAIMAGALPEVAVDVDRTHRATGYAAASGAP